ncbi:MAG: DNA replication/repair protein RecF [Rhizobiaceae bacterium]|nr:DNA replication/repair protein RecF [Rhizobiaceae bacterium]
MAFISKLTLTDFRNYSSLGVGFHHGAVVLTGDNGAGKTNLLEAISFLAPGRGFRRALLADVAREGGSGTFAIHASIDGQDGPAELGTGTTSPDILTGESSRKVRINGANARSAEALLEWLRVMWLTPAMDGLFTGSGADRRRFLDRLVVTVNTSHSQTTSAYEKAMRDRNRMLTDNVRDDSWFAAVEAQMAEAGTAVAAARAETLRLIAAMVEKLPGGGPFPQADLMLDGVVESLVSEMPAVEAEEHFRALLAQGRERDRAAGRAIEGPHRSDLRVRHRPKDMPAELCSTGEQKALLVGIVLSHARLCGEMSGLTPILLLDEIAAHLDAGRRAALFEILDDLGGQSFMTGTEAALFSSLRGRAQFLRVDHGSVTRED